MKTLNKPIIKVKIRPVTICTLDLRLSHSPPGTNPNRRELVPPRNIDRPMIAGSKYHRKVKLQSETTRPTNTKR